MNFLKLFLIFKLSLCSYRLGRIHTLHLYDPAIFFKRPSVAHLSWNLMNNQLKLNTQNHVSNRDGRIFALSMWHESCPIPKSQRIEPMFEGVGSVHLRLVKCKRQMIRSSQQGQISLSRKIDHHFLKAMQNVVPFWIHLASLQEFLITWKNMTVGHSATAFRNFAIRQLSIPQNDIRQRDQMAKIFRKK